MGVSATPLTVFGSLTITKLDGTPLTNTTSDSLSIKLTLRDNSGVPLTTEDRTLDPHATVVIVLSELLL